MNGRQGFEGTNDGWLKRRLNGLDLAAVCVFAVMVANVPAIAFLAGSDEWHDVFGSGLGFAAISALWLMILLVGVLGALSPAPRLLRIVTVVFVAASAATSYFAIFFGVGISREVVLAILSTNVGESVGFLGPIFALHFAAFGLIPAIIVLSPRISKHFKAPFNWRVMGLASLVAGLIFALYTPQLRWVVKHATPYLGPANLISAGGDVARRSWQNRSIEVRDITSAFAYERARDHEPVTVVLIIGESARGDHFQIGGYARPTSPRLAAREGVVYFDDATSCATSTSIAVPCLLSRLTTSQFALPVRETSLVGVLRALGFATFWYSVQDATGSPGILRACNEADVCSPRPVGSDDVAMLPFLDQALLGAPGQDRFIVLHAIGSHLPYKDRVPKGWGPFQPGCKSATPYLCSQAEVINSYDNSILYTDQFVDAVIERVSDRKAIVVYASDHGESLGEGGRYGHAMPLMIAPRAQTHIPFVVWTSRAIREAQPEIFANLTARRSEAVSHDNIFSTILGCLNVRSQLIDPALDLCGGDAGSPEVSSLN